MITRIISGAALVLVIGGILVLGSYYSWVLACFAAIVTAIACYEILNNTAIVKKKISVFGSCIFGGAAVFAFLGKTLELWHILTPTFFVVLYALFIVFMSLYYNKEYGINSIAASLSFPVIIAYSFSAFVELYGSNDGLFYLLLLINFSSVCDTGAYFTGVLFGKHKLCPNISPKKTVEGAIGGVVWSIICSVILCLAFDKADIMVYLCFATVPFCVVGMFGDLFASVIKRSVDLKDYGKLIPGHGGILDRFDSILLIAPVLKLCVDGGIF